MIENPGNWVTEFAGAGADIITVHAEATPHLDRVLKQIREAGCKAGVSLNPSTPLEMIEEVLDEVDLVLIMSVNPGFGGQKFIKGAVSKVERLNKMRGSRSFVIEIDGGINVDTISQLRKAGVDVFVAGSAVFSSRDRSQACKGLKQAMGS